MWVQLSLELLGAAHHVYGVLSSSSQQPPEKASDGVDPGVKCSVERVGQKKGDRQVGGFPAGEVGQNGEMVCLSDLSPHHIPWGTSFKMQILGSGIWIC